MALVLSDRVQETSTSTGTGTITLAGAVTGYQSFAVIGNTNTTYYTIADQSGSNWEVGIGTYYLANTSLARTTILASSNANAVVTFGPGTKSVFVTYPAEKAIYSDASNVTTITNFASSNVLITGGTISGANFSGLGTMATQNANAVAITGGALNNVTIGLTTPNAAVFTTVNATANAVIGANIALTGATNPILAVTGNANNYIQSYIYNLGNGTNTSADFTAYPINGTDTAGWVDVGITGPIYNQATYAVTGANEGYVFMSAPTTSGTSGNLVFATDSTGVFNSMQFYTGGFAQSKANVAMTLSNNAVLTVKNNVTTQTVTATGNATTIAFNTVNIVEPTTVNATGAASTINFDVTTQSVYYSTANATANWTVNFRGSSTLTLANALANNQTITVSLLATQGATAYYNSLVQIDGSTVTPKWQGGTAPTSGNTNSVDVYNYVITKISTAPTYTVLASVTKFA